MSMGPTAEPHNFPPPPPITPTEGPVDEPAGWVTPAVSDSGPGIMVGDEEIARRRQNLKQPPITNNSPWQELYRANVGQLSTGACLDFAVPYRDLRKVVPRHSH